MRSKREFKPVPVRRYFVVMGATWLTDEPGTYVTAGWSGVMNIPVTLTAYERYQRLVEFWNKDRTRKGEEPVPQGALATIYHIEPNEPEAKAKRRWRR